MNLAIELEKRGIISIKDKKYYNKGEEITKEIKEIDYLIINTKGDN